ncbi:MAG: hypothetical protein ACXAEU_20115 [Candidatus Hodarchaeales archaeon]
MKKPKLKGKKIKTHTTDEVINWKDSYKFGDWFQAKTDFSGDY